MRLMSFVAVGLLLGALQWGLGSNSMGEGAHPDPLAEIVIEGATELELPPATSQALGVDSFRFFETVIDFDQPVWVYAGHYRGLSGDAQIHAPEHCYPGSGFEVVQREVTDDHVELIVANATDRRLVWYVYRTGRASRTEAWELKLDMLVSRILRQKNGGLLVRMSTPLRISEDIENGRGRVRNAWNEYAGMILEPFVSEGR